MTNAKIAAMLSHKEGHFHAFSITIGGAPSVCVHCTLYPMTIRADLIGEKSNCCYDWKNKILLGTERSEVATVFLTLGGLSASLFVKRLDPIELQHRVT